MLRCGTSTNADSMSEEHAYTNNLIHESSPYLLQHAHNPVNWYAWGEEALAKAVEEDKPILVSIGYSACHWCHVMERESFEDTAIARIMNERFVCIKVDREERPDVDQIYMDAVQLMTGRGGWPLNCFALPDGKPFFGGTYFRPEQWTQVLERVSDEFNKNKEKVYEFADRLTTGVQQNEFLNLNIEEAEFDESIIKEMVTGWKQSFDNRLGGANRAPKFPLPNNYQFLLRYGVMYNDQEVLDHVELTLDKIAQGGIYDHLGGGFARYSTDIEWKVPHFEKMLYDNAQLISLYTEAYQWSKKKLYAERIRETIEFLEREMSIESGGYYSALDADSEGEEGKYYIWTKEDLDSLIGEDFELFSKYWGINARGKWEHGNYILVGVDKPDAFAAANDLTEVELQAKIANWRKKLMSVREGRIRPGLDDKSLTSWNAMMTKALADAYAGLNEPEYLTRALRSADFILDKLGREDGGLSHTYKEGKATINGYLDDYSFTIEALLRLHEVTADEQWLTKARGLLDYTIKHFFNSGNKMFFYTSDLDKGLIARKMEINDNVIPASNSSMAKSLFYLGQYFDEEKYLEISKSMLNNVRPHMAGYGPGYSNWAMLYLHHTKPFYEVAISGKNAADKVLEFGSHYIPNKLFIAAKNDSKLPLMEYKYMEGETTIYVCVNKSCQMPVNEVSDAMKQITF